MAGTAKVACEDRARRQPRQSRAAAVEVRAARVTLRGPWRPGGQLPDVTVNAVLVREVDPPADDVAVEWLLLTSLPIDTDRPGRAWSSQYYCTRWMVEVFFRVLKSGCRVEERRFERSDRLLPCLAVYLIVAWRTLYVCRLGRSCPEISCEAVFEPSEWQSVYQVVKREPPPKEPPKLQEMVRLVAQLGGYVNRKRADEPGPQTVWLGLQRLHDIALCWKVFGPGAAGDGSYLQRGGRSCVEQRGLAPQATHPRPSGAKTKGTYPGGRHEPLEIAVADRPCPRTRSRRAWIGWGRPRPGRGRRARDAGRTGGEGGRGEGSDRDEAEARPGGLARDPGARRRRRDRQADRTLRRAVGARGPQGPGQGHLGFQ